MSRHVSDERLDVIHAQLSGAIRQVPDAWIHIQGERYGSDGYLPIVPGHDLICLLDELRMRRQVNTRAPGQFPLGKTARLLMSLQVGQSVDMEPITKGALTTARVTARKRLGTPDAVWWSQTQPDGLVRVTRAPDGSAPHAKYHNPAVYELAAMQVGETRILRTLKGKMHNNIKIHARLIMDNAQAAWRCWNLVNGDVRCERTR